MKKAKRVVVTAIKYIVWTAILLAGMYLFCGVVSLIFKIIGVS